MAAPKKKQSEKAVTIESLLDRIAETDPDTAKAIKKAIADKDLEIAALQSVKDLDVVVPDIVPDLAARTFTVTIDKKKVKAALPAVQQFFFGGKKYKTADAINDSQLLTDLVKANFRLIQKIN
jgi:hypothetical protein